MEGKKDCPWCKKGVVQDEIRGNQAARDQHPTKGATRRSYCTNCGWESKWRSDGFGFKLISIKKGAKRLLKK